LRSGQRSSDFDGTEMTAQTEDSDLDEEFGNDDEIDFEDSAIAVDVNR
jgi:hypothetical protein